MTLNGLNIRKGLELEEVTVADIFLPNTKSQGNKIALEISEKGWDVFLKENKEATCDNIFDKDGGIMYLTEKIPYQVNSTLTAYVYECYVSYLEKNSSVTSEKNIEIDFVNTERLNIRDFCRNIMEAQAFAGNYESPDIKYSFAGFGDFSMSEYAELHNLVVFSRLHMLDFFIFYKGILSSVGFFLSGLFENDIKQQKEYLTLKEYNALIKECKNHRRIIAKKIAEFGDDFEEGREED